MKNKILKALLCSILVLSLTTGCNKSNSNGNEKSNNVNTKKNNVQYSTCAKTGNKCSAKEIYDGQIVKVSVNNKKTYDFYVVSDDGEQLTLLMKDYADIESEWLNDEDLKNVCIDTKTYVFCGPYTAYKNLNIATSEWTKINDINEYIYEVAQKDDVKYYKNVKITNGEVNITDFSGTEHIVPGKAKARIISLEELNNIKFNSDYPDWLFDVVAEPYDTKKSSSAFSFTMTPDSEYYGNGTAYTISKFGKVTSINSDSSLSIIPVITINKESINK